MKLFGALKAAAWDFSDDECMTAGAALAYYTIFSLPPLLVVVFFVAETAGVAPEKIDRVVREQVGIPLQQPTARGEGDRASQAGTGGLATVAQREGTHADSVKALGPASRIIGVLLLIFSATGVFGQLQSSLNRAWEVEPDPEQGGMKNFLLKRVLSLGMIVVIAFLLLVSLVLTTLVDEIVGTLQGATPSIVGEAIAMALNAIVTVLLATLLFAAMYKILPDADMQWKDVWVASFITAVLFVIGKTAIGYYVQNSDLGSSWGSAAASMVAMLVWVYYSSLIVLFGAELAQVWAARFGAGIMPSKGAVRIKEEKRQIREPGSGAAPA